MRRFVFESVKDVTNHVNLTAVASFYACSFLFSLVSSPQIKDLLPCMAWICLRASFVGLELVVFMPA